MRALLVLFMLLSMSATTAHPGENPAPVAIDWNTVKSPAEPFALFPEDVIFAASIPSQEQFFSTRKSSLLRQITDGKHFEALRTLVFAKPDAPRGYVDILHSKTGGIACAAAWGFHPKDLSLWRAGGVLEWTDGKAPDAFKELIEKLGGAESFIVRDGAHGLRIHSRLQYPAAFAQAGRFFIFGINAQSVEELAGRLLKPGGLDKNPRYLKAAKAFDNKPLFEITMDTPRMLKTQEQMPNAQAQLLKARLQGREMYEFEVIRMYAVGNEFEEKFVQTYLPEYLPDEEERLGLKEWIDELKEETPLPASYVPANALLANFFEMEGDEMGLVLPFLLPMFDQYLEAEAIKRKRKMLPFKISDVVAEFEQKHEIELAEMLEPLSGTHAWWVLPVQPPVAGGPYGGFKVPDIGAALSCIDKEEAETLAENIERLMKVAERDGATLHGEKHGESLMWIFDSLPVAERANRPFYPTQFVWATWNDYVILGTSKESVKAYLEAREKKQPTLADQPDLAKFLKALPIVERHDQSLYVDLRQTLTHVLDYGKPYAPLLDPDPAIVKAAQELPAGETIFKDVPPIRIWATPTNPEAEVTTMRSPLPLTHVMIDLLRFLLNAK